MNPVYFAFLIHYPSTTRGVGSGDVPGFTVKHGGGWQMRFLLGFLLALMVMTPAQAQIGGFEKSALREDFAFPVDEPVRILVFRPDVQVGEQTTGGMNEPNAEWTEAARKEISASLERAQQARSNEMLLAPEFEGDDAKLMADYRALFQTVAGSALIHKLAPGNRLPTKKDKFDWSLGPGVQQLGAKTGADYGLFFSTADSYGSTGRKVAQVAAAVLFGAWVPSGIHQGYAGLVDLKTGDLVWLNVDMQMGGDVRTTEGADKRVAQLLEEFPTRESVLARRAAEAAAQAKKK